MTDAPAPNASANLPSDETQPTFVVPTLGERVIVAGAGQAATALAAMLVGGGLIAPGSQAADAAVFAGVLVGAANLLVTWLVAKAHDARLRAAVAAPPSIPILKS